MNKKILLHETDVTANNVVSKEMLLTCILNMDIQICLQVKHYTIVYSKLESWYIQPSLNKGMIHFKFKLKLSGF